MVFGLDLGQITFNLVKNALASRQLGFLATGIAFCDISLGHAQKSESDLCLLVFRLLEFFFPFPFSPFLLFFAAVIDLLLGLRLKNF